MVLVYVAVLTAVTLVRHFSFQSSAWDLGIFSQAFYNTLRGKIFVYNAELYANPSGSIFGVHFSPILFLILPFFALVPSPETLLIVQTLGLAIGAYPVYFLTRQFVENKKIAYSFSLMYLLYPHTLGVNIFDFHPDAFFVSLSLLSLFFFTKKKWGAYFIFMFLAFSTKEFTALMFFMFGVGDLLLKRKEVVDAIKKRHLSVEVLVPVLTLVAAGLWYVVASSFIRFFNPSVPSGFREGSPWSIFGANPVNPLTWFQGGSLDVLGALHFDFQFKVFYLITILAPLAFLPVFRSSRLLSVVLWLGLAFLSNYRPYYGIGFQYSALLIPFSFLAAIEGFQRLGFMLRDNGPRIYKIGRKLAIVGVFSALVITALLVPSRDLTLSLITKHDSKLQGVLDWIRSDFPTASVLTQYDIFPHISDMTNASVIPPLFDAFERPYYFDYVKSLFDVKPDLIILDLNPDLRTDELRFTHLVALQDIYGGGNYGLYGSVDGVLIYKYNYSGSLARFEPFTIHYENVNYTGVIDRDTDFFSYTLPPGIYNVTYHVKIDPAINQQVFTSEVRQGSTLLVSVNVSGSEFQGGVYQSFTTPDITIDNPFKETTFSIVNPSQLTEINVDFMEISITQHLS